MSKEKICIAVIEKHKALHAELNKVKIAAGLKPDPYTPIENKEAVREVYAKYEKLIPVTEDEVIQMFNQCGDLKQDYHIIKTKKINFESDIDAIKDEAVFFSRMNFKNNISISESKILDLIKKDKRISPETIAKALNTTAEWVTAKIGALTKAGILESKVTTVGDDEQVERTLTKPLSEIAPENKQEVEILIKYSYEGPKDDRNRPFCRKLLELDRLYSRAEIERISLRLGYSVFDRRGGWWTQPDGTHSPTCRHRWQSNVITRKRN